jgi:hypothetical protein
MRTAILAIAVLAPSVALSAELWPDFSTGWRYALTEPAGPGRQRFGYVDAETAGQAQWRVRVECGVHSTRDGRVLRRVVGTGTSTRGASPGFGGNWENPDGARGSFVVTQDLRKPKALRLAGELVGPECPRRGVGDLSSGD